MGHICRRHPEMKDEEGRLLETVSSPDVVQAGDAGTLIAIRDYPKTPLTRKYCAVDYGELGTRDGFIVTGYFTSEPAKKRKCVWKRSNS